MARSTSSPRRAPLPADAEARLHRSVSARLSATLDDPELERVRFKMVHSLHGGCSSCIRWG
jgi:hypothetical protein